MKLNGGFRDPLLHQKVLNLYPLVTLELDDFAIIATFDEGTIASEFLSNRNELPLCDRGDKGGAVVEENIPS